MLAIEFKATIKNGFIKIPDEYQQQFERQKSVKVILMKEENASAMSLDKDDILLNHPSQVTSTQDLISQLLSTPLEIENFFPLKREEIYD